MISLETINETMSLVEEITKDDVELNVVQDTPMDVLTSSTTITTNGPLQAHIAAAPTSLMTDQMKVEHAEDTDNLEHNAQFDKMVEQLVSTVTSHLAFTRNEVLDSVNKYIAAVQESRKNAIVNPISRFNVIKVARPPIIYIDLLAREINKAVGPAVINISGTAGLGYLNAAQLLDLVSVKNAVIDKVIQTWIYAIGMEVLQKTWNTFFCSVETANYNNALVFNDPLDVAITDPVVGADIAALAFLMARGVKNGYLADVDLDAPGLRTKLYDIQDVAGAQLLRIIKKDMDTNNGSIVVNMIDSANKTVYVNAEPYMTWIRAGGKNEVLFGSLVKQLNLTTAEQLQTRADEALAGWSAYLTVSTAEFKNTQMREFTQALRSEFYRLLTEHTEAEDELFADAEHVDYVSEVLERELQHISSKDMNNVEEVCLRIMCKARYYYTDAYKILTDINTYSKENPELSVKEAALAATINYVTDYICNQIIRTV